MAITIIKDAIDSGIDLMDIYIDVFQEAMLEVGNLWHQDIITVDKEHACTAITQMVMTELYPIIFSVPRKGLSILACCVGNELHEMGVRMLCDVFELKGWDSIYIGASVPSENVTNAIIEHHPDLIALSVTMPHHLKTCAELIEKIRANPFTRYVKIAVGGRAVNLVKNIDELWNIDVVTKTAPELVLWAEKEFK